MHDSIPCGTTRRRITRKPVNALQPALRYGPILLPDGDTADKDPCPVLVNGTWHLFGTDCKPLVGELDPTQASDLWGVLHATAPSLYGPWTRQPPAELSGLNGGSIAAPGVIYDPEEQVCHLFVHTDFLATGGSIEHAVSTDMCTFTRFGVALPSIQGSGDECPYDVHPFEAHGKKYLAYAGSPRISFTGVRFRSEPDIYVAESESGTWYGPWKRLGKVISQEEVPFHNQVTDPKYEWGLEGPQVIELPSGILLMNATCFVPGGRMGTRQRVFFAAARRVEGPYAMIGTVLDTKGADFWESGENGHATGVILGDNLVLLYQGRHAVHMDHTRNCWLLGCAAWNVADVERAAESALRAQESRVI